MKNSISFADFADRIEKDTTERQRFFAPRRKQLQPVINAIQRLLDDELDELIIETPPRIGKTTLMLYLTVYLLTTRPDEQVRYKTYAKHDDAIDSMAQLLSMVIQKQKGGVKTFRRRW